MKITGLFLLLITASLNAQIKFNFLYNDIKYDINKDHPLFDSLLFKVDSIPTYHSTNYFKHSYSSKGEKGFYNLQISDGSYNGYWVSIILKISSNDQQLSVDIYNAKGIYAMKNGGVLKYWFHSDSLNSSGRTVQRNGRKMIFSASRPSIDKNYESTIVNEILLSSSDSQLIFGTVSHKILMEIFKYGKIWNFQAISQEELTQLNSEMNDLSDVLVLDKDKRVIFSEGWKKLYSLSLFTKEENTDYLKYNLPNNYINSIVNNRKSGYQRVISNENSLFYFVTSTELNSDVFRFNNDYFVEHDYFYRNIDSVINLRNGIIRSVSEDKSQLYYDDGRLVNPGNDTFFLNKKIGGIGKVLTNSAFSFEFQKVDEDSIALNGLANFSGALGESFTGYFEDGIPNGLYRYIVSAKTKEYGTLLDGKRDGWIRKMDKKGRVESIFYYREGVVVLDSLNKFFTYYNFDEDLYLNESPRSIITFYRDSVTGKILSKERIEDITTFDGTFDGINLTTMIYVHEENKIYFEYGGFNIIQEVELVDKSNNLTKIVYRFIDKISNAKKFHLRCKANPETGLCLQGGAENIKVFKSGDEDYVKLRKAGRLSILHVNSDGSITYGDNPDLVSIFENTILDGVEAIFKPITKFLGAEEFGLTYDSEQGYGFLYKPKGLPKVEVSSSQFFSFINEAEIDLPYFENYLSSLRSENIRNALNDPIVFDDFKKFILENESNFDLYSVFSQSIFNVESFIENYDYQMLFNSFLNENGLKLEIEENDKLKVVENKRVNAKLFIPKPGIPYYWDNIMPPTIYGTVRYDYGGISQDLLAIRDRKTSPRLHKSVDYFNPVGAPILSPSEGKIIHIGWPESDIRDNDVRTVWIQNRNNTTIRLLYLTPNKTLKIGDVVNSGQVIGVMPDMRKRFINTTKEIQVYPENVTNHIHMVIILRDGSYTDRGYLFKINN